MFPHKCKIWVVVHNGKTMCRNKDWFNLIDERVCAYPISAPAMQSTIRFLFSVPHRSLFQEAIQLDGEILFALLRRVSPLAFRHLEKHKIDPILYMTEWFMCAFSRTLPWASVLRVWDMFLCDGMYLQRCLIERLYSEIDSSAPSSSF